MLGYKIKNIHEEQYACEILKHCGKIWNCKRPDIYVVRQGESGMGSVLEAFSMRDTSFLSWIKNSDGCWSS